MASTDKELEVKLMEAGKRLSKLPSSVDELLPLLDQVENFLSRVEQSPLKTMQDALSPSLNALVEDKLLRHSDVDVKVAAASCISEITRITAPDAPYDDDKMKEVFQLIVSSFENLSDKSSRSYNKRASILETVAKVRSCVVMLDLECDRLIVEMFQHLLKEIRDYHPEHVFTSMETIMTLVLEESEDVALDLLTPILASLKRDNEEYPTISRKLGERVFENCAVKLKPYLIEAVRSSGISLDDYSRVVASICEGTTGVVELNDENASGEPLAEENKLTEASLDEAAQADESKLTTGSLDVRGQVTKENVTEEACPEEIHDVSMRSPKSVMINGDEETRNEGTSVDPECLKKPEDDHAAGEPVDVNLLNKVDTDDSEVGKMVKSETKPDETANKSDEIPVAETDNEGISVDSESLKTPVAETGNEGISVDPESLEKTEDNNVTNEILDVKLRNKVDTDDLDVVKLVKSGSKPQQTAKRRGRKPVSGTVTERTSVDPETLKKTEDDHTTKDSVDVNLANKVDSDDSDAGKSVKSESKPVQSAKRSGRKSNSILNTTKPSDSFRSDSDKEDEKMLDPRKDQGDDTHTSPCEDQHVDTGLPPLNEKEIDAQVSSPKVSESDAVNVASISPGESLPDENHTKKAGRPKKKESLNEEDASSVDLASMKVSAGTSDTVKRRRRSGKKSTARFTKGEKNLTARASSKTEVGTATSDSEAKAPRWSDKKGDVSDTEAKPPKQSGKKGETSKQEVKPLKQSGKKGNASASEIKPSKQSGKKEGSSNNEDKVSPKKDEGRKRGRGKDTEKDLSESHTKNDAKEIVSSSKNTPKPIKDEVHLEEDTKVNSKRKHTPGKDKVSGSMVYGEDLIGAKVKVWWPKDKEFYEGVVDSFDPVKKKHKVSYTDGDEETLYLPKEKWEFVEDETMQEEATKDTSPDTSEKAHKKKAKPNSDSSPKQEKTATSLKRSATSKMNSKRSQETPKTNSKASQETLDTTTKTKSGNKSILKARESEAKSGKKRRRT